MTTQTRSGSDLALTRRLEELSQRSGWMLLSQCSPGQPAPAAAGFARASNRTLPADPRESLRILCAMQAGRQAPPALPQSSLSQLSVTSFVHLVRRLLSTRYNVQGICTKLNFTGSCTPCIIEFGQFHGNDAPRPRANLICAVNYTWSKDHQHPFGAQHTTTALILFCLPRAIQSPAGQTSSSAAVS